MSDEVLPEYVPRDADDGEHGLRAAVAAAAERGGFVLLVGGSSVGKTRCAAEAVRALLPDWRLVHPGGPGEVAALAAAPPGRVVVWLDELQRYLGGEHGLTGGIVRALLNGPRPIVILGTLWPDRYTANTTPPPPGSPDLHAREREVLDLATVIRIVSDFSPAEQDLARVAAARDRRLRIALDTAGYGLTQTLAGAPQLVARWEDAKTANPYGWAVLTAALDLARLGACAPLSPNLLRAAAPGYCTSQQQAQAPKNWFKQALTYATRNLHGDVAALRPAGASMGRVAGYIAADYLIQHASRERRYERIPASTWDASLSHIRDPDDTASLADSAKDRLLYCYAIPLYRHAADTRRDEYAASQLAELLAKRGDTEELRARADAGHWDTASRLAELLAQRGDLEGLRARADDGDMDAASRLASLLAQRGDLEGLRARARADVGDMDAASRLASLLAQRGDLEELRARADDGDETAVMRLADLLAERGDLDEAEQMLRDWVDGEDGPEQILHDWGYVDHETAIMQLAWLRARRGDMDGLRARADAGDWEAARRLVELLAERGDLDGLRARADADMYAAPRLAELLAERGDLDGLRARADVGDMDAASRLAELLAKRGDIEELRARADDHWSIAMYLAELLAERGDIEELRARAGAGDETAVMRLAELLAERGDLNGAEQILRARAAVGDETAVMRLAELLAERGDLNGAEQILRARTNAGEWYVGERLVELLNKQDRSEEAERLRRFGLNPDGSIAFS